MPKESMWAELQGYLDDDERLVWPDMYLKNRRLYDSIRDVVYLVKERDHPGAHLQWVSELGLPRLLKYGSDVDIMAKLLIVRLLLPWRDLKDEWLISQEELDNNREYYDIVDIFLRVRRKDNPKITPLFDVLEFEKHRDQFEVVEAKYLVALKMRPEERARLLGIDPDSIHTYMSE